MSETITETTTVPVTGINVKNEPAVSTPTDDRINNIDVSGITTADAFANAMQTAINGENYYGPYYTGFVDYKGNLCCWTAFTMMQSFDNDSRYPIGTYYSIVNGTILSCTHQYSDYEYQYSLANAVWNESYRTSQLASVIEGFEYNDFDKHLDFDVYTNLLITQSLFNNDDAWEYITPDLYETTDTTYSGGGSRTAEGTTIYRTIKKGYASQGYKIVSDDGRTIAKFDHHFTRVWKINGNIYFYGHPTNGYNALFLYDNQTSEIKELISAKQRISFVSVTGETIDLQLSNEDTDSEAVITSMGGQTTGKYPIAKGHTYVQINAANLSKGIYNVSVQRNGQVLQSQNVLIQ